MKEILYCPVCKKEIAYDEFALNHGWCSACLNSSLKDYRKK